MDINGVATQKSGYKSGYNYDTTILTIRTEPDLCPEPMLSRTWAPLEYQLHPPPRSSRVRRWISLRVAPGKEKHGFQVTKNDMPCPWKNQKHLFNFYRLKTLSFLWKKTQLVSHGHIWSPWNTEAAIGRRHFAAEAAKVRFHSMGFLAALGAGL